MKKKRLFLATLILMVTMTACGGTESDKDDDKGKDKDSGKKTEQTVETLQEVSEKDFDKVSEEVFGVAIENEDWEVKEATSPNGVNNLTVTFEANEDVDGVEIIKKYFEETKAVGKVYGQEIDWDTLAVSKGTEYTDFETFYDAEVTAFDGLYSTIWLYDYDDRCVQFSVMIDGGNIEISQCFATLNQGIDSSIFADEQTADGWNWNDGHGWIDGVWDSNMLPDNFPKEIEGVKVRETEYYKAGEKRYSARVGDLYFDDYNYEEWQLTFYASAKQVEEFQQALTDNGFVGTYYEDYNSDSYIVSDGEIYLYYVVYPESGDGNYEREVWCDMTIPVYERPKEVVDVELPEFGLFTNIIEYCVGYAYDENFNDVEFEYDFIEGKGSFPAYYNVWFDYMGVTREQYDEYISELRNKGYEDWDEYGNSDYDGYYVTFQKDGVWIGIYYNYQGEEYYMTVAIASEPESLYY